MFTKDQKNAIDNILPFIAEPFNPTKYIVGLIGAGGVGKTYITNYIINHCKYSNSVITCASTTHKACRVFSQAIDHKNVDTIQSVFGLRPDLNLEDFDPRNPQFNPKGSIKLDNAKLLIIDECSMLPASLVTYICKKCKERDIKIIFIGDGSQLPPVGEKRSIAFDRCYKTFVLKEIVRQKENNSISILLNLLRNDIANKTYDFIKYINTNKNIYSYNDLGEGFSICDNNDFTHLINARFTDTEYTKNIDKCRVIAYTNKAVESWNKYVRNLVVKNADNNIITKDDLIMSYKTIVNDFMETIINNSEEYIIHELVDYVDNDYGFKGYLIKFQMVHGGAITKPLFLIDHRDVFTRTKYYKTITELINSAKSAYGDSRINLWKEYYKFKKRYITICNILNNDYKIEHACDIDYGFAITSHRSQGSTYDTVFVDLHDMMYDYRGKIYGNYDEMMRRIYVACSRASKELIIKL